MSAALDALGLKFRTTRSTEPEFTHVCPVPDCNVVLPRRSFMCYEHWRFVPAEYKRAIGGTYLALLESGEQDPYAAPAWQEISAAALRAYHREKLKAAAVCPCCRRPLKDEP